MKIINRLGSAVVMASLAGTSWGFVIDVGPTTVIGEEVGVLDVFVGEIAKDDLTTLCGSGNSAAIEECWVNSVLAPPAVDTYTKVDEGGTAFYGTNADGVNGGGSTTTSNTLAFAISADPVASHFLIKNSTWFALYENNAEVDWAHFDAKELNAGFNVDKTSAWDDWTISHYGVVTTQDVPAPASIALLGFGLAFIGMSRRKSA